VTRHDSHASFLRLSQPPSDEEEGDDDPDAPPEIDAQAILKARQQLRRTRRRAFFVKTLR
jgi:hypothetical protein